MRPSDMDAIARVIGQLVKEEMGKLKTEQPDTSHYDAQFKALGAENASLSDQVKALVEENQNLTKTVSTLMDRINTTGENLNKRVTSDEFDAVALTVASCVKMDDHTAVINSLTEQNEVLDEECKMLRKTIDTLVDRVKTAEENLNKRVTSDELDTVANNVASCVKLDDHAAALTSLDERLTNLSKFTSAAITKDDVNALIETMWDQDLRNQVAAMLPDEVDMSKAVETVHNMVMSELPEMVVHAIEQPEFPLEDAKKWVSAVVHKWFDENMDRIKGEKGEAALPQAPTDLQVIEAVKTLYPSIRQDLIRRLPAMEHKGVWNADTQYDVGDEVIKNGSTYRLMEPSTDSPPSEAWQMISQGKVGKKGAPGRDGEKGERGEQGKDGVGIKDVVFVENMLVVELTDGSIKEFDLTPLKDDMGDQE